jgi:hypothetical protein
MFAVEVLSVVALAVLVAALVGGAITRPRPTDREQIKERLRALGPDPSLQDLVDSLKEHPEGRRRGG